MELISDTTDVKVKDDKVQVTRTIVEEFNPSEYLQNILKMEVSIDNLEKQKGDMGNLLGSYRACEKEAKELEEAGRKDKQA
jgi:hypothetical protein